jgi:hypothetical protein
MFEVGVVVQHDGSMLLGYGRGEQIDHPRSSMMATSGHPQLHLTGPLAWRLELPPLDTTPAEGLGWCAG